MATVTFKAKPQEVWETDLSEVAYRFVKVPVFTRSHCDMAAFRNHAKFGGLANSDLFPNLLKRIRADRFKGRDYFRLDQIPEGVTVDLSGYLAVITFEA